MSTSDKRAPPSGSVLDRHIKNKSAEPLEDEPIVKDCYTEMPTPMAMVDFVDGQGDRIALPYHALESARFNRSGIITLQFHGQEVELKGRNLKDLYSGLTRHRVIRIEATHRATFVQDEQPVVTEITLSTTTSL